MKIVKAIYFMLCFCVACIFFYFFCYSRKPSVRIGTASVWSGIQSLIAYSEENQKGWDIRNCVNPVIQNNESKVNDNPWQTTKTAKVFLYSAFVDSRIKRNSRTFHYIRILGMSEGEQTDPLYCQLWYANSTGAVVKVQQNEIWVKNWDFANSSQYYRPHLFSCPAPADKSTLPTSVSVVSTPCENPTNQIRFRTESPSLDKQDFVVCLKAIDSTKDISLRFIEWIELQFLLGVDKISAYVYNVHPNVKRVLDHYEDLGKVYVKYHSLPGRDPNEPSTRSEFLKKNLWQKRRHEIIQYNDCFYEHMNSHKFVVVLDLDEAILPMMHATWRELLDHVFSDHSDALRMYASLSATNVYFFDTFGDYTKDSTIPPYMHMLRHIYRSANFSSPGLAVKSFHSTNNSLTIFNHYTLVPLYSQLRRNALIGRHLAQLHHYRSACPALMEKECAENFMKFYKKDTAIWKFKMPLIENVKQVARELNLIEEDMTY